MISSLKIKNILFLKRQQSFIKKLKAMQCYKNKYSFVTD